MKKRNGLVLLIFILSIVLGAMTMYYPMAKTQEGSYSIERVRADLKEIAKAPHTTLHQPQALAETREYIAGELKEMGIEPKVFTYPNARNRHGDQMEVNNIYGVIDGKNKENGSYILLMAHYDSGEPIPFNNIGYSYGMADDGYGVVTMLETLRAIKESGIELENGIKVLFTDAEEQGLLGSEKEFKENFSYYKNVACVLNLEARGTDGPVMMIQTNSVNSRQLELLRASGYPMTTSLLTDLNMGTGRSDFFHAESKGLPGLNYAVLDKVENYHTPGDGYGNASDYSLSHYREQVLPVVEKFVTTKRYGDVDYFKSGSGSIFFTLLPNVVVSYPLTAGKVISVGILITILVLLYRNKDSWKEILIETGINLLQTTVVAGLGFGLSYGLASLFGVKFELSYMCKVPGDDQLAIVMPILLAIGIIFMERRRKTDFNTGLMSGILIYGALLAATIVVLPGGSYLFMVPLAFVLIGMAVERLVKNGFARYAYLGTVVAALLLALPLLNIFNMTFSIGALGMILGIVMLLKILLVPILKALWTGEQED